MSDNTPEVDTSKVLVERRDNVMIITINRPEARNAVDGDVWGLVGAAVEEADNDVEVRAIIITGAGDKAFSAGLDLKALATGSMHVPKGMERWNFAGICRHFTSKPVIGAVNGAALGGGIEIALACDLIVAAEHAVFGLPEVKRGLFAAGGGVFRITDVLPKAVALEMMFVGDPITAEDALRWGMINRVVPTGQALEGALELAARIAENAPLAVQASKRLAYRYADDDVLGEAPSWDANQAEVSKIFASKDAQEGPRAFAEKRKPVWTGR